MERLNATSFEIPQTELYFNFNMAGYGLLNWQKEEIGKKMIEFSLDPALFTWKENAGASASEYRIEGTPYFFRFEAMFDRAGDIEETIVTYSPGQTTMVSDIHLSPTAWHDHRSHVVAWLRVLKREVAAVDPWSELLKQRELADATATIGTEDTAFTLDEINLISTKVEELKGLLIENNLIEKNHQAAVESNLDFLVDEAKKQGRRAWRYLALGAILQLLMDRAFAPEATKVIGQVLTELFRQIGGGRFLPF